MLQIEKKHLQIKKTLSSILQHTLQMLTTQPKKKRAANRKKHLQIKKTLSSILQHTLQMLTTQPKKKCAANRKYTCKLRKHFRQFDNTHAANAYNTTKKEMRCK